MAGVSEPDRDLALQVERQPLLGAAGGEVDVAAHRPQKIGAAAESTVLLRVEHAALQQLVGLAHAIDIFRDPEQRVQVAQAAFAVLDIGFDQIARLPAAAMPLLALGELGGDELGRGALYHFLVEAPDQLVVERPVAGQEPGLEDRGADRHVAARLADRFVDRTGGVADLQSHVPQAVEDGLGDLLAPRGLLVGQDEQQIDVGFGRHQAAAVAAGRNHRHALGAGGDRRAVEVAGRGGKQDADDLVLHETQPLGATPSVPVLQQQRLRGGARGDQLRFKELRHGGAEDILMAGLLFGERVNGGGHPRAVEAGVGPKLRLCDKAVHNVTGYRTALPLSREIVAKQFCRADVTGSREVFPGGRWWRSSWAEAKAARVRCKPCSRVLFRSLAKSPGEIVVA